MTRLARRATLLVAFSLLTSTATAYAECAWVVWGYVIPAGGGPPSSMTPLSATNTMAQCDQVRERMERLDPARSKNMETVCLPDTIDPREPKGK